jgi:hypothetical protein
MEPQTVVELVLVAIVVTYLEKTAEAVLRQRLL